MPQAKQFLLRLLLLLLVFVTPVVADTLSEKKARLVQIAKELKSSENRIKIFNTNKAQNAALIEAEKAKANNLLIEQKKVQEEVRKLELAKAQGYREKLRIQLRKQIVSSVIKLRFATDDNPKSAASQTERAKLKRLQDGYMTLMMDLMLSDANQTPRQRIARISNTATKATNKARKDALDTAARILDKASDDEETRMRADAEAIYRIERLEMEAVKCANLILDKGGNSDTRAYLEQLANTIASNDPNNFVPPDNTRPKEVYKWFRTIKREIDLEEFRRVAAHGAIFDEDEKLVTGKTRQEIAYFNELALAKKVESRVSKMPISRLFWPTDSREALAKEIEKKALENPDYMMFAYLQTGIEPSPRMYMMAVQRVLRLEQEKVNNWLHKAYNQSWYNTGLGTLLRASNAAGTGQAGFNEVKKRIDRFNKELDALHKVFDAALKHDDIDKLNDEQKKLLKHYGYIKKRVDGTFEFSVPKEGGIRKMTSGAQGKLKLPGAAILDVITPKNVAVTVAGTVIPGAWAARIEALAAGTGAGWRTVLAVRILAEMGAGMALDAITQAAENWDKDKKVDVQKLFLESVMLGGILEGVNSGTTKLAGYVVERISKYEKSSVLKKLLSDDKVKEEAAKWASDVLGLASESAITSLYESQIAGHDVTFDTFLSNLVNSTITRSVGHTQAAIKEGKFLPKKKFNEYIPKWLKKFAPESSHLFNEVYESSRDQHDVQAAALGRYLRAVGSGEATADRLFSALLKGEISWLDLTIAYQTDTAGMTKLMEEVKVLRDNFFEQIKVDALQMAHKELKEDLRVTISSIQAKHGDTKAAEDLINAAWDKYLHDFRYMSEQVIAPGSKSPVSDIDRSVQHPRLRQLMERMFEVRARERNDGGFIPTSARAFDVNEYYNVMPFISDTNKTRNQYDLIVTDQDNMKHGEVMEAFGYAAAMMHMVDSQKTIFKRNERQRIIQKLREAGHVKDSPEEVAALDKFKKQIKYAEDDLSKGKRELLQKMTELDLPRNDPESEIRARSELYQDRIDRYYAQLKKLDKTSGYMDKRKLRAKIEREMAYMLREGIETYSGSPTLDIIVSQMQIAKLKMGTALTSESFTLNGDLKNLKPEHLDIMINDQVLMMIEHINGYYHGHEMPYNSGKALAKYAQRALLAMKIKGDIPTSRFSEGATPSDPVVKLHNMTSELMALKANPQGFLEQITKYSKSTPKTPDGGLKELMLVIEHVVPGMKDMSYPGNFTQLGSIKVDTKNPFDNRSYFRYVRMVGKREEEAISKQVKLLGGGKALLAFKRSIKEETEKALKDVTHRFNEYRRIGDKFEPKDWAEVLRLEREIRGYELIEANVIGRHNPQWKQRVSDPHKKAAKRLEELRKDKLAKIDVSGYSEYARLWLQMHHLKLKLVELEKEIADAKKLAEEQAKFAKLNLSGVWEFYHQNRAGTAKIEHVGQKVKMWITWKGMSTKGPHFVVSSNFRHGRLLGDWEELHSRKLTFKSETQLAPAKTWNNRSVFRANAKVDGSSISIAKRNADLPKKKKAGWTWEGLVLTPSKGDIQSPTNLDVLTVTTKPVAPGPRKKSEPYVNEESELGVLWVTQKQSDSGWGFKNYSLYTAGTYGTQHQDLVTRGNAGSNKELKPGTYDLVADFGIQVVKGSVTITAGQVSTFNLPSTGRASLRLTDYQGRELQANYFQLRLMAGKRHVTWLSRLNHTELLPGEYDAIVYMGSSPFDIGPSFRKKIKVTAFQDTAIEMRFGALLLELEDVDGKPIVVKNAIRAQIKNTDGTFSDTRGGSLGERIDLLPGVYSIGAYYGSGNMNLTQIPVKIAEQTKKKIKLARITIRVNNKTVSNKDKYRLHITPKNSAGSVYTSDLYGYVDLAPGTYQLMLIGENDKSELRTVTLKEGEHDYQFFTLKEN